MKLLKVVGLGVGVLGVIALVIVLAPVVRGQAPRDRPVLDLYHFGGLTQRASLGVEMRDVDAADVTREKLAEPAGAAIDEVHAGSPAEKAGLKAGDIVVSFDGERVRSARHLARLIDETPDGRQVETAVVRNGERLTLQVAPEAAGWGSLETLRGHLRDLRGRLPERFDVTIPEFNFRDFRERGVRPMVILDGRARLGVGVQELSGQLGEYFGADGGVLVTEVDAGTPAARAGLRAGDVIAKINDQTVRNTAELRRQLAAVTGDVRVTIVRDRKEQTLTVALDEVEQRRPRIVR